MVVTATKSTPTARLPSRNVVTKKLTGVAQESHPGIVGIT
jgi:hypothetical protein